jgi:hypothetical protein
VPCVSVHGGRPWKWARSAGGGRSVPRPGLGIPTSYHRVRLTCIDACAPPRRGDSTRSRLCRVSALACRSHAGGVRLCRVFVIDFRLHTRCLACQACVKTSPRGLWPASSGTTRQAQHLSRRSLRSLSPRLAAARLGGWTRAAALHACQLGAACRHACAASRFEPLSGVWPADRFLRRQARAAACSRGAPSLLGLGCARVHVASARWILDARHRSHGHAPPRPPL